MFIDNKVQDLSGKTYNLHFASEPDECPLCHNKIHPKHCYSALVKTEVAVQVVFRCPHQACLELFIATYTTTGHVSTEGRKVYHPVHVAPRTALNAAFPESITTTSPTFVLIYNQAMAAEAANLDQLVGIGLRKALEFLVKDFAVREHPGEEEKIRKKLLGDCIDKYLKDPNVKLCAKRAAWLGNDETHYTRKWLDKDIEDLKMLVKLTVNWIENELLTKQYLADMPDPKEANPQQKKAAP